MDALENVAFRSPKQKALVSQLYKDLRFGNVGEHYVLRFLFY